MKRFALLLCAALASCFVLLAQNSRIRYAGDPLSDKDRAWIERFATAEVEFYEGLGMEDTINLQLTVFDKKQDAWDYLDSIKVTLTSLYTAGLYIPGRQEMVILGREKWKEQTPKVIIHELAHHLTRLTVKKGLPGWLNEGLSEYFEHCELGKKGLKHTLDTYVRGRIRTMYMLGEVDLKGFIDLSPVVFKKKLLTDEQYGYILSHAIVTFGLEEAEKDFMKNLVALLNEAKGKVRFSDLVGAAYPGGFAHFEQDFSKFCNSR